MLARVALVPLLAFVALSAWALSSPVGSGPDEDYHLASIWCGQGMEKGVCEASTKPADRRVPEPLVHAACFAFHADVSGSCQDKWYVHESDALVSTHRVNSTGEYPPLYYFAMHVLVGKDVSVSVVAMRLVNAALFVGLLTATYWLLPGRRRIMLVLGTAVALVPLGVFIIPSVNPSSWAVTSAAVLFSSVVGVFETTGRCRIVLAAVALLATVMGAGARADAAMYAALAAALATFLTLRWRRAGWKPLVLLPLVCVISFVGYASAGQGGAAAAGMAGYTTQGGLKLQIVNDLLNVPSLWAGAFGSWGLGWLDTGLPPMVWVIGLATFGALVYAGLTHAGPRKLIAVAVALLAAWVVPTIVLIQSHASVGAAVQPRYLVPLLVLLAQVALFRVADRKPQISAGPTIVATVALTVTNALALHIDFRRYLTGTDVYGFNLDTRHEWWWAIPVSPMTLWVVGAASFGAALYLAVRALLRGDAENNRQLVDRRAGVERELAAVA